jgi:hypothetical protein
MTEDLRKAALAAHNDYAAAFPGVWTPSNFDGQVISTLSAHRRLEGSLARFRDLANPAAILALYAELDRLREAVQERDDLLDNERGGRAAAIARAEKAEKERDEAQSACTAWQGVYESLEAHLKDRINMRDEDDPSAYLRILHSCISGVIRDSRAIVASRWADADRARASLAAVTAERDKLREALTPFAGYLDTVASDIDNKGKPLPDDQAMGWVYLTVGRFRRAREALKEPTNAE